MTMWVEAAMALTSLQLIEVARAACACLDLETELGFCLECNPLSLHLVSAQQDGLNGQAQLLFKQQ